MSGVTPGPARYWHMPRLAVILWRFTRATPWLPQVRSRREDIRTLFKVIRWGWVRVFRDRRGVAGFIVRDGRRIHALYVDPDRRNMGVGRALLDEAKAETDALDLWVLEANAEAQAFYAANGFTECGRSPGYGNDENLPDILMVWTTEEGTDP